MKNAHKTGDVKSVDDLHLPRDGGDNSIIDNEIAHEVEKFNQLKIRKQV